MKKILYLFLITAVISLLAVNFDDKEMKVIKYFPFDETKNFTKQKTELKLLTQTDDDSYKVGWSISSKLEKPIYLRQDLSLLFVDGKLKGILNQWKEEANNLEQKTVFNGEDSSHYEAISLHHGEVHYPDDLIKSIQVMTHDQLYIIDSPHSPLETFREPISEHDKEWKRTLDHAKFQQLTFYWNRLMEHYQISKEDYLQIPLIDLWHYQHEPFPTLTLEQTQHVIGQLWEGLYKHYIIGIKLQGEEDGNPLNTYMPLILVDKDGQNLFVLYEDSNGQKRRLIQSIPDFN